MMSVSKGQEVRKNIQYSLNFGENMAEKRALLWAMETWLPAPCTQLAVNL